MSCGCRRVPRAVSVDLYLTVIALVFHRIVQSWYAGRRILRESEPWRARGRDAAAVEALLQELGVMEARGSAFGAGMEPCGDWSAQAGRATA